MAETIQVSNGVLRPGLGMTFTVRFSHATGPDYIDNCMLFDYKDRMMGPAYKCGRGWRSHVRFNKNTRAAIRKKAILLRRRLRDANNLSADSDHSVAGRTEPAV